MLTFEHPHRNTTNIHLVSPDWVPLWTHINIGVLYKATDGISRDSFLYYDSKASRGECRHFDEEQDPHTLFASSEFDNSGTPLWTPDMLASDNLPMNVSTLLAPGDELVWCLPCVMCVVKVEVCADLMVKTMQVAVSSHDIWLTLRLPARILSSDSVPCSFS
jgi:hypothetical protein